MIVDGSTVGVVAGFGGGGAGRAEVGILVLCPAVLVVLDVPIGLLIDELLCGARVDNVLRTESKSVLL